MVANVGNQTRTRIGPRVRLDTALLTGTGQENVIGTTKEEPAGRQRDSGSRKGARSGPDWSQVAAEGKSS